jgi:hypothetical protein
MRAVAVVVHRVWVVVREVVAGDDLVAAAKAASEVGVTPVSTTRNGLAGTLDGRAFRVAGLPHLWRVDHRQISVRGGVHRLVRVHGGDARHRPKSGQIGRGGGDSHGIEHLPEVAGDRRPDACVGNALAEGRMRGLHGRRLPANLGARLRSRRRVRRGEPGRTGQSRGSGKLNDHSRSRRGRAHGADRWGCRYEQELGISLRTARRWIAHIMADRGVTTRFQLGLMVARELAVDP